jgi:hypothetical protein
MLSNTICGGVLCLSVANMTHIILKFVLALTSISIKETQFILQNIFTWTKKKEGMTRMAQGYWHAPTKVQTPNKDLIFFSNNFVPKDSGIQAHHCLLLWKATIIGISRLCAKSTSLGYNSNY